MDEIFYLMRHGGGGFSFSDCYSMPTQIRKYNVRKLSAEVSAENEKIAEANGKPGANSLNKLANGPAPSKENRKPDYIARAPKK